MVFLDPTVDMVFKRLFGVQEHKHILICFLNGILEKKPGEHIVDVTITDPNNIPERDRDKYSAVDVKCIDEQHKHYIVEMQVMDQKDYDKRCIYYS